MPLTSSDIVLYGRHAGQAAQVLQDILHAQTPNNAQPVRLAFVSKNRVLAQVLPNADSRFPVSDYAKHGMICQASPHFSAPKKGGFAPFEGNSSKSEFSITLFLQQLASQCVKDFDTSSVLDQNDLFSQAVNSLTGDFYLGCPDESGQCFMLATSAFNAQTLFYASFPDLAETYLISANLALLLQLVPPKVCQTALSLWLSGRPDPNRSLYANIHQVPQASVVLFRPGLSPSTRLYWDINPNTTEHSVKRPLNDYQDELSAILQSSVADCLPPSDGQIGDTLFTQLSGGMDSTSVSATAWALAQQQGLNLHSVSHTYKHTAACDESDNIAAMIARYPFTQSHFIELDKFTPMRFGEVYPTHVQSPGMVLSPKYHEEAALLNAQGAGTLLTGNGGDEMFWGHSLVYFDRLMAGDMSVVGEVSRSARQLGLPVWGALKSALLGPLKRQLASTLKGDPIEQRLAAFAYPAWLTGQARALIEAAPKRANPFTGSKHNLARYARYEGLFQTSTFNSMRSYQAVFDNYGLQVKHPLMNKALAQFSFDVPQHLHISGEFPKLLLRQAMSGKLPEQVCWNKSKTVFDQHFANLIKHNQTEIRALLAHEALADLGLIDNHQVLSSFDKVVASPVPSLQVDLLYAILVQSWYQTYCVANA
ncbi:asparagine synthase [Alteromonas sediminis]|uniref:asparagine synthase (glutamine-hydrolyzing) n=1 Tax=Alteromonas sediminis TaxID=2259342 RepID=A0A3N5ZB98_9ALTE|nr:asparagine synthase C-terminal domain-containing protein [Alteromonas sediminis]RPJ68524.1 asparagine synthase [Alteromonas sediminis]